jgi:glycosyltransferase involved in cell wall biosynthesis
MNIDVLALPSGDVYKASSRWVIYNRTSMLKKYGIHLHILHHRGSFFHKIAYYFKLIKYSTKIRVIIVQGRLLSDVELMLLRLFRVNIIYIYVDAIFEKSLDDHHEGVYKYRIQALNKLLLASAAVVVGNNYIKEYSIKYNSNVHIIPGTFKPEEYKIKYSNGEKTKLCIGWIGYSGNGIGLLMIKTILKNLIDCNSNLELKIISDKRVEGFEDIRYNYVKWTLDDEDKDISEIDIGLAPMVTNPWTKGKVGSRPILFAFYGIPTIASPVGINKDIFKNGQNILYASSTTEWEEAINLLILDKQYRKLIGNNALSTYRNHYSAEVHSRQLKTVISEIIDYVN